MFVDQQHILAGGRAGELCAEDLPMASSRPGRPNGKSAKREQERAGLLAANAAWAEQD